jgi:hypothetical protein
LDVCHVWMSRRIGFALYNQFGEPETAGGDLYCRQLKKTIRN